MQITELSAPTGGGTIHSGQAISRNGCRYTFGVAADGEIVGVFREARGARLADDRVLWLSVKPPRALRAAVKRTYANRR